MTAAVPLVERLAEALAGHRGCFRLQRRGGLLEFDCGIEVPLESPSPEAAHLARALLPVVEQAVAEARGEAAEDADTLRAVVFRMAEDITRIKRICTQEHPPKMASPTRDWTAGTLTRHSDGSVCVLLNDGDWAITTEESQP